MGQPTNAYLDYSDVIPHLLVLYLLCTDIIFCLIWKGICLNPPSYGYYYSIFFVYIQLIINKTYLKPYKPLD